MLGLPFVVGHAVDDLPGLRVGNLDALLAGFLAIPARQAVAAKAGQIHQVDILDVDALLQMRYQPTEGGGFEVGTGLVVHGDLLRRWSLACGYRLSPGPPQRRPGSQAPTAGP